MVPVRRGLPVPVPPIIKGGWNRHVCLSFRVRRGSAVSRPVPVPVPIGGIPYCNFLLYGGYPPLNLEPKTEKPRRTGLCGVPIPPFGDWNCGTCGVFVGGIKEYRKEKRGYRGPFGSMAPCPEIKHELSLTDHGSMKTIITQLSPLVKYFRDVLFRFGTQIDFYHSLATTHWVTKRPLLHCIVAMWAIVSHVVISLKQSLTQFQCLCRGKPLCYQGIIFGFI